MGVLISCDRVGNIARAAVWGDRKLLDLYVDRIEGPDLTGALVWGRLNRALPVSKQHPHRAGWFDCGPVGSVYVEGLGGVKEGEACALKIKSSQTGEKAFTGAILFQDEQIVSIRKDRPTHEIGILKAPPRPFERAVADWAEKSKCELLCHHPEDLDFAKKIYAENPLGDAIKPLSRQNPHPELEDLCAELLEFSFPLSGGGNVVIEKTEAFWTVDINGGEAANPLNVNMAAMRAIARRARLCNMGGIILVDALKMLARPDISKMLNVLKRATSDDPAQVQIFGVTKLGIIEMTRTRRGPSLDEILKENA